VNVRERLREQLKIVPKSVMEGGVMTASLWKAKMEKASKLMAQPRASEQDMERALYELMNFK